MDEKGGEDRTRTIELEKFSRVFQTKIHAEGGGEREGKKKQKERAYLRRNLSGPFPIIVYLGFLLTDLFLPFVSVRKFL